MLQGQLGYTMFFVRTGRLEVRVAADLQRYLAALATVQSVRGARLASRGTAGLLDDDEDDPDSFVSWLADAFRRLRKSKVVLSPFPAAAA